MALAGTVTLDGLSLTGTDAYGVEWHTPWELIGGWWSSPAPAMSTAKRPRAHGVWAGDSWLDGRTVEWGGFIEADTDAAMHAAVARLTTACALADVPLVIDDTTAMVRRSGELTVKWLRTERRGRAAVRWSVQVLACDPRRLGVTRTSSTGLPSTSGGWTFPLTLPAAINATVVSGQASLINPGNIAGPVTLRIDGPVTGPIVTHVNSGKQLVFAASLALGAGEFVEVNMDRREVLAQGQSSRNGWVTSRGWSSFVPGDNTWAFTSSGGVPGGMLTITATPAWM